MLQYKVRKCCAGITRAVYPEHNQSPMGVEAFLYCQLEGAVGDETVTLARQQSTDIFFLVRSKKDKEG